MYILRKVRKVNKSILINFKLKNMSNLIVELLFL